MNLGDTKKEGLLKDYVVRVLKDKFTKELLSSGIGTFEVVDEDNKIIKAVPEAKIQYLLLVTKLEALINVLGVLYEDDNIVYSDEFKEDSNKFIDSISKAIEISIKSAKENEQG